MIAILLRKIDVVEALRSGADAYQVMEASSGDMIKTKLLSQSPTFATEPVILCPIHIQKTEDALKYLPHMRH